MRRSLLAISCPLIALAFAGLTACSHTQNQTAEETTGNPADGNLAPASEAPQAYAPAPQAYAPAPTAPQAEYPEAYYPPAGGASEQPVEAQEAPPPLPEYTQPPCPGDNYIWNPGYWAWSTGYYWVPGAWVMAPWVGALWTPPWWGYQNNVYLWHAGFWGPHIGFYGGINYGFGYPGRGYYGAYWNQGRVYYNRDVTNVNITVIRNYYSASVPRIQASRISYNGGPRGVDVRPTRQELAVGRDPRLAAVPAQVDHARQAIQNRAQFAGAGNQRPEALVAARPLATNYRAPEARPPEAAVRVAARPAPEAARPAPGNARPTPEAARPEFPSVRPPTGRPEQRPVPPERAGNQPAPEIRQPGSAPRPGQAERTTPAPRPEVPARPEQPRAEAPRPVPQPRPEQPRAEAPRPVPQARPEQPRAAAPRPEPQARPEPQRAAPPRPVPQARPEPPRAPAPRPATPEEKRKEER